MEEENTRAEAPTGTGGQEDVDGTDVPGAEAPEETAPDADGLIAKEPPVEGQGAEPGIAGGAAAEAHPKAGVLNRVIARFIDILIALLFAGIPGYIGFFAALTYIGIADGFMGGRSIGKRVIGLRVICNGDGRPANFRDSILRNSTIGLLFILSLVPVVGWALAAAGLGLELVLIIGSTQGKRLGDEIASTVVLEETAASPGAAGA